MLLCLRSGTSSKGRGPSLMTVTHVCASPKTPVKCRASIMWSNMDGAERAITCCGGVESWLTPCTSSSLNYRIESWWEGAGDRDREIWQHPPFPHQRLSRCLQNLPG